MRSAVTIALTVLALAGTAAAQPSLAPPGLTPTMPAAQPPPPQEGEVSENTALVIAIGGTTASYGMLILGSALQARGDSGSALTTVGAIGTLIAPSAGRWYAHSAGWRGLALRLAGVGTGVLATAVLLSECGLFSDHCDPTGAAVLGIAAAGLYVGGTIDDIVMAPRDARRHNEALHQVALVPVVRPGDHGLGLAVAARF